MKKINILLKHDLRQLFTYTNRRASWPYAFALKIGVSRAYMSAVETSKSAVTLDMVAKIANGLDLPPWRLLFDEGVVGEE